MGAVEKFTAPASGNPFDADLDSIRDNYNWLLMQAVDSAGVMSGWSITGAKQWIVIPGWNTTVDVSVNDTYARPDAYVLTRGTRTITFNYTWTSSVVTAISMCYNDGVSGEVCLATINLYYIGGEFVTTSAFALVFRTTTASESITLPLITGHTHDCTVDWGDGSTSTITAFNDADRIHTYTAAGDYDVTIVGTTAGWSFATVSTSKNKLLQIKSWGSNPWTGVNAAFFQCNNLTVTATDAPVLSGVTTMNNFMTGTALTILPAGLARWNLLAVTSATDMFSQSPTFTGAGVENWDVSSITDMSGMFVGCTSFNANLSAWDVSSLTLADNTFDGCAAFTGAGVSSWNIINVTSMLDMLSSSGLTTANYDAILIAWAALAGASPTIQSGVSFDAPPTQYTSAATASRAVLTGAPNNWSITDGGLL